MEIENNNSKLNPLPLLPGAPIKVAAKTLKAELYLKAAGTDVWIVKRIQQTVYCLKCNPGLLLETQNTPRLSMWVEYPEDQDFEILGRLAN